MADRLNIVRERPRGFLPRPLEVAWDAIWDNFTLLRDLVGYEDVTITPAAGSNEVSHGLGKAPRRWSIIRAYRVTGAVYETASTATTITLYVVSVGTAPELVVRLW